MGFMPFFGLLPFILVGGAIYLYFRTRRHINDSRSEKEYGSDYPRGGSGRVTDRSGRPKASELYRLAHNHGGTLTVSDVVVELGVEPAEAEAALESITDGQRVQMEVSPEGRVTYRFVEINPG
jgi:hypothetical protein